MSSAPAALVPATAPAAQSGASHMAVSVYAAANSTVVMILFFWMLLVTFQPTWVCLAPCERDVVCVDGVKPEPRVDLTRAFVISLVLTIFIMAIFWLVSALAMKK